MRSVSALDVRRKFGEIQPIAAIVPLADLALVDPERRKAARLAAIDEIARYARRHPFPKDFDAAAAIREQRDQRTEHIADVIARGGRP